MNINRIDLNLLVYFDVLLKERNVTRAANQLGISQPAMSNGLRRLRTLLEDPLLVRTSEGMTATERAVELQPLVHDALARLEKALQPHSPFEAGDSDRVFRIVASDYAESTLLPKVLRELRTVAPDITLDIITPSDVEFADVEQGKVDMVINRFDTIPQSFHQKTLWVDSFSCILSADNSVRGEFNLESYLASDHVWVSKTGWGVSVGINPKDVQRLGWVDETLIKMGKKRRIRVFTRHYQTATIMAEQKDLIVTIPTRAAQLQSLNPNVVILPPPFVIPPIKLKMAWSPLLQHNPSHQWLRRLIARIAEENQRIIE